MTADNPTTNSLKKALSKSSIGHMALFVLAIIMTSKLVDSDKASSIKKENTVLIRNSVRVDVVAMPKMTLKELEALADTSPTVKKSAPAKKSKGDVKELKSGPVLEEKTSKNFLNKLKQIGNKKTVKIETKTNTVDKGDNVNAEELKKLVLAGNKMSAGVSITGEGSVEELSIFQAYGVKLASKIREYFRLPSYLLNKELTCRVQVFISPDGDLLRSKIYQSSGVNDFDQKALQALELAAPFPSPPAAILERVKLGAIILGFPL